MFKKFIAAVALTLLVAPASAAVLDFTEATAGWQGTNIVTLSNATITNADPDIFVSSGTEYGFGSNAGFCGVTAFNGFNCSTVVTVDFADIISNLMFNTGVYGSGDTVTASIFSGATLLSSMTISSAIGIDFTGFSGITSLILDGTGSTSNGYSYGDFEFDVAAVPLPASGLLLLAGFGALGAARRRKQAA